VSNANAGCAGERVLGGRGTEMAVNGRRREEMAEKTGNTGCLAGLRCPACGSLGPFSIACVMWLNMTDEGTDDDMCGEAEWTPASGCRCVACGATGVVSGFRDKKGEGTE